MNPGMKDMTATDMSSEFNFTSVPDVLPVKRNYKKPWHRTKMSPCAALMHCSQCKTYLPITDFYNIKTNKISRQDILGINHNSECIKCSNNAYVALDPRKKLFYSAKARAKRKGIFFDISLDDIVIPELCPVFGTKLKSSIGTGAVSFEKLDDSPTIDRIDNSKGYTADNICVISLRANNLKRDATLEEIRLLAFYMENPVKLPIRDISSTINAQSAIISETMIYTEEVKYYIKTDHRTKMLRSMKQRGKSYRYDDNLTNEDIVIPEFCPVLGIKIEPSIGKGSQSMCNLYNSPSIDRIDNSKGYVKGNIQVISLRANWIKGNATLQEVKALLNYMETMGNKVVQSSGTTGGEA